MGSVFVIDDFFIECLIISDFCQKLGINVIIVISGEEVLEKFFQVVLDVIILDIVLLGCSGFEIC